jgi:hypothetical protein
MPHTFPILLNPTTGVSPEDCQGPNAVAADKVSWINNDNVAHKLKFTTWPFQGPKKTITARPGVPTAPRRVVNAGVHTYTVTPPLPRLGPPDGPAIIVD